MVLQEFVYYCVFTGLFVIASIVAAAQANKSSGVVGAATVSSGENLREDAGPVVCSTSQLASGIGLYTASLTSSKDILIGQHVKLGCMPSHWYTFK